MQERHLKKRLEPIITAAKKIREREHLDAEILETLTHPQKAFEQVNVDTSSNSRVELVVIGGCTGGTQALFSLVGALPGNLEIPVVIVQHLPRIYTSYLSQKLNSVSDVSVREVQDGVPLDSGGVWIAPGGYQCEVGLSGYQKVLRTHRGMRENNMRPSIDILFRSAAKVFAKKTMGILLSGYGYDGLSGAEDIRNAGGQILVQDPRTAVASELPLAVIRNGLSREYFSPEGLARQIMQRVSRSVESEALEAESGAAAGKSLVF
ncbi:MAG: CheB methylesterase domain-containing protein [Fodinibius sp.]|nr:CheB methylesterase domain-containing protein [Fodinibius sp.]